MLNVGDEVVHQSHPGRFAVLRIDPSPGLNMNGQVLTIRSREGVEMKVLDGAVRKLETKSDAV